MNDDDVLRELRGEAEALRFTPDALVEQRLAARIRDRVTAPAPGVFDFLAGWSAAIAATLVAVIAASTLALYSAAVGQTSDPIASQFQISSPGEEIVSVLE